MKREEFISKVEELGLFVEENENRYYVVNELGKKLATIKKDEKDRFQIDKAYKIDFPNWNNKKHIQLISVLSAFIIGEKMKPIDVNLDKKMRREEFISQIEKLGLNVQLNQFSFSVIVPDSQEVIAIIFNLEEGCLAVKRAFDIDKQHKLLELCVSIAMTEPAFR